MDEKRKITIAIAWINLVENVQANDDLVNSFLSKKSIKDLEECAEYLKNTFTTDEMISAAEKFSGQPVF